VVTVGRSPTGIFDVFRAATTHFSSRFPANASSQPRRLLVKAVCANKHGGQETAVVHRRTCVNTQNLELGQRNDNDMPFHDLNVAHTSDHADLSRTLAFHAELGYGVVAISSTVTGKLPTTPQPVDLSSVSVPPKLTVLSRLTVVVSDAGQNHRLASFQPAYSLLALRPTTEAAFQLCCHSLECDLISLDFSVRLPFILKFKTVASALQRGVRFEICYAPALHKPDSRRNLIAGATSLIRATRGRGVILSSEASSALGIRAPHDVVNLTQIWGLGQERGKEAVCEEAAKVLRLAALKRTSFRGVVDIIQGGGDNRKIPVSGTNTRKQTQHAQKQQQGGSKNQEPPVPANGIKRKASTFTAATNVQGAPDTAEKPPSKREMKRRAKKARMEGEPKPSGDSTAAVQNTIASGSPTKEALETNEGSKKS
jgi:ribonuclease P/MRP protein subunit RPP1